MPGPLALVPAGLPAGVTGCFTTRAGGVSEGPWASLNLAAHVSDDPRHVLRNRDLLARELDSSWVNLPQQVHGDRVRTLDAEQVTRRRFVRGGVPDLDAPETDALVTQVTGAAIGVLVADCLPVLVADPVGRVVAAAHAGRRGLVAGVLQNTVAAMMALGSNPGDCVAVIGPAVCGQCYEVPETMRDEVAAAVPGSATTTAVGTPGLDLPAGAEAILRAAGLREVRSLGLCTMTDPRFYSYRRDGETGRFAGVVMLDPVAPEPA